jgi:adenylate cyclase
VTFAGYYWLSLGQLRESVRENAETTAVQLGLTMARLLEERPDATTLEIGEALRPTTTNNDSIVAAAIYSPGGRAMMGLSVKVGSGASLGSFRTLNLNLSPDEVALTFPLRGPNGGRPVGTLALLVRTSDEQRQQLLEPLRALGALFLLSMLGALIVSRILQRGITDPITRLAEVARKVATEGDYSVRAGTGSTGSGETAVLVESFNSMLTTIQQRDADLLVAKNKAEQARERLAEANRTLEAKVAERTADLQKATNAAREANQAKSAFLAKMSHDLRTPLNQIIGYTEMLIETAAEGGSTTLTEDLQRLHAAAGQILALLNEGLAQWKVESGQVDLVALRRSLLGPLNSVLGYRDLCEETARTLGLSETVADLEKVGYASRNLRKMLEQESFAERYHLGAPIPVGGSTPPIAVAPRPVTPPPEPPPAVSGHLLVVDDEPLNREMLIRRLKRMGFTAAGAENGMDALDIIGTENFDLVLLDILMPVLDGFQTLERLKASEQFKHIPVIMLTALDEVSATVRCIEAGAEDFVPKPFNPVILRARIGASLEKKRLRDQERAYLDEIKAERAKSDQLLLNVLPEAIAERLKSGEETIVDAVADATVLFADIVGFTKFAAEHPPGRTVALLNELFSEFDRLVEGRNVEKIKTIGDQYMVVSGVSVETPGHAAACADMALSMMEAMGEFNERNKIQWEIRIGMHSGPLVAGIIGSKKFANDLWGDTVNIASRLESHGEAGLIQVSEVTAELLKRDFALEKRGAVELKHRGKITAYRLVGRK